MSSRMIKPCYFWHLLIFLSLQLVIKAKTDFDPITNHIETSRNNNLNIFKVNLASDKEIDCDLLKHFSLINQSLIKSNMFLDVRFMNSEMFETKPMFTQEMISTGGIGGFLSSSLYFGVIPVVIILLLLFIIIFMCTSQNDLSPSEQESKTHVTEVNQLMSGRKSLYKRYVKFQFEKAMPYPGHSINEPAGN